MGLLGSSVFRQNRRVRFVCGSNKTFACARNFTAIMSSTGCTLRAAVISFVWVYFAWTFTTTFFSDVYTVCRKSEWPRSIWWLITVVGNARFCEEY